MDLLAGQLRTAVTNTFLNIVNTDTCLEVTDVDTTGQ